MTGVFNGVDNAESQDHNVSSILSHGDWKTLSVYAFIQLQPEIQANLLLCNPPPAFDGRNLVQPELHIVLYNDSENRI